MTPSSGANKPTKTASSTSKKVQTFTEEEHAAMRDHAREMRGEVLEDENAVLAKIAEMKEEDRAMGKRLHSIIRAAAPSLAPRLWYGMPAYSKNGKVICFFQPASKFKTRYSTFGFQDKANLDDGNMWPVAWALKGLTAADEAKISSLVKRAAN